MRSEEDAIFLLADAKGNKTKKWSASFRSKPELRDILKATFMDGMCGYILPPSITELKRIGPDLPIPNLHQAMRIARERTGPAFPPPQPWRPGYCHEDPPHAYHAAHGS